MTTTKVLEAFREYYKHRPKQRFIPGETYINYSGFFSNHKEWENILKCVCKFWITHSEFSEQFERRLKERLHVNNCILTNSGSSANLLAISALTSITFLDRRLKDGDEVIIPACCFPTTISPIVQNRLIPVFLDSQLGTYNINPLDIERAISQKTKAILISHTLGNPVNMELVMSIARKYKLWVIEDFCDGLGSKYKDKPIGTFGDIGTLSFYPAHQISTGEGGALVTNDNAMARIIKSYRDWGRDCWCKPGEISSCNHRFEYPTEDLPKGYDHKYIFTHIGYNLKITDLQSAIGLAQMDKLSYFISKRQKNFNRLYNTLLPYRTKLILPEWDKDSDVSWFGFPISLGNRYDLIEYLEKNKIQTRLLFAGNILKQPAFKYIKHRTIDNLNYTNEIMRTTLFLGVYPGIKKKMIDYICNKLKEYFECLV